MPLQECSRDGKKGYKWGSSGACYTHDGSDAGIKAAKKKAIKQAIAIGDGKMPRENALDTDPELAELAAECEREYADEHAGELETVELRDVEILAAGGPVHGQGSPPEGDYWSEDDLRRMAASHTELADELHPTAAVNPPKNKLGHVEQPAVGYLYNFRVKGKAERARLVADVRDVPKTLGKLIKAKAYQKRSIELSRITSQKDGKRHDWVVTGLAWLGAKLPAVRTLEDVVALYGGEPEVVRVYEGDDDGLELQRVYEQPSDGTIVWDPRRSIEAIRAGLREALNPGPPGAMQTRYWIRDVSTDGSALVCDGYDEGAPAWVVPFEIDDDGTVTPAASSEWVEAEQTWVATSKNYAARADTGATMPEQKTYTDEQRRKFAEAAGLEQEKVTDEMLAVAGVPLEEASPPKPSGENEEGREHESDDPVVRRLEALEQRAETAEKRALAAERDAVIDGALRDGKITPGEQEGWKLRYEASPDGTRTALAALPKNEHLAREYGHDGDGDEPANEDEALDKLYEADAAQRLGITGEELL